MDKETLSQYGWIVICIIIISILLGLASPFGNYIKDATWKALQSITTFSADDNENNEKSNKIKITPYMYAIDTDSNGNQYAYITGNTSVTDLLTTAEYFKNNNMTYEEYITQMTGASTYEEALNTQIEEGITYRQFLEENFRKVYNMSLEESEAVFDGNYEITPINDLKIQNEYNNTEVTVVKKLCCQPELQNVIVPDTISIIENDAFAGAVNINKISIPNKVTVINKTVFAGCDNLKEVHLPGTITEIKDYAFENDNNLKYIYFNNYRSVWNSIVKDDNWNTNLNPDCIVICLDEKFNAITNAPIIEAKDGDVIPDFPNDDYYVAWNDSSDNSGTEYQPKDIYHGSPKTLYAIKSNLLFTLSSDKTYYSIGNGKSGNATGIINNDTNVTKIVIPSTHNGLPVKSINIYAFNNCNKLKEISIPSSITSIGSSAFNSCKSLNNVILPSSLSFVASDLFYNCSSLTSIEIPQKVWGIGEGAFNLCSSLNTVKLNNDLQYIYNDAFSNTGIKNIIIPNSVTNIGNFSFQYCENLESVIFANSSSLTSIGRYCFYNCKNLKSIIIPNSVTNINDFAFKNCYSLMSVSLSSNAYVGNEAFAYCKALTNVTIPSAAKLSDGRIFYNTPWLKAQQEKNPCVIINGYLLDASTCTGELVVPNNVVYLSEQCLSNSAATNVVLPNTIKSIGADAFEFASGLSEITYLGTQAEWNSISKYGWNYKSSIKTVNCTDGNITVS